jgi:hypothetical protein
MFGRGTAVAYVIIPEWFFDLRFRHFYKSRELDSKACNVNVVVAGHPPSDRRLARAELREGWMGCRKRTAALILPALWLAQRSIYISHAVAARDNLLFERGRCYGEMFSKETRNGGTASRIPII